MKLTLVSTTNKQSFEVAWLEVNSSVGNFVMQRGHAPMILLLHHTNQLVIVYRMAKKNHYLLKVAAFYTSPVKKPPLF